GADRLISAAETLGDGHQVGRDPFLRAGVKRSGAPHAAHDLVEDEQHAVAVADRADASKVVGNRRDSAERRSDYGLGNEGDDGFGSKRDELVLQSLRGARGVILVTLVFPTCCRSSPPTRRASRNGASAPS